MLECAPAKDFFDRVPGRERSLGGDPRLVHVAGATFVESDSLPEVMNVRRAAAEGEGPGNHCADCPHRVLHMPQESEQSLSARARIPLLTKTPTKWTSTFRQNFCLNALAALLEDSPIGTLMARL